MCETVCVHGICHERGEASRFVACRAVSSLIGSVSCLLGLYAGLGVPPYFGISFVPTALVAPFLVMGVGTDDIFVIISSYALAYGEDTPRTRCGVCLRGCGKIYFFISTLLKPLMKYNLDTLECVCSV